MPSYKKNKKIWNSGKFFHAAAGLMIVILCLVILGEDALGYVTNKHTLKRQKLW